MSTQMKQIPQFICETCHVMFHNFENQKIHLKCDWHIYNMKRKIAQLPPVTMEEFNRRVINNSHANVSGNAVSIQCKICKKHYSSQNQYDNHLHSKKHKDQAAKIVDEEDKGLEQVTISECKVEKKEKMEVDSDVESVDSETWAEDGNNPATWNECLFCNHGSKSWVKNLKHMTMAHSFFIPDIEYCIDVKGLIEYLGEKVFIGYICIWCCDKGKCFQSAEAVQSHMLDKGHCKMLHEGENLIEYEDFYDYSSSYPDAENADPDEAIEIPELDNNDFQLVLPSGAVIGHRSLMKYYKQSLNPNSALCVSKNQKLKKILPMYKALGWKGETKESIQKKARDIHYMHRMQAKYSTKLQFKSNKFQPHFRRQVVF